MTRALEPVHPAPRLGMGRAGQTPGSLSPLAGDLLAPQQMLGSPGHCCQQVEGWGGAPCEVWQSGDKMEFASLSLEPSWHPERRIFFFFFFSFFQRGESSNASLLSSKSCRFHFCSNNPEYKEKILWMWFQLSRVDTLHSSAWLIGEKRNPMKNSLCTFPQPYIECLGCYLVFQDFSVRCVIANDNFSILKPPLCNWN